MAERTSMIPVCGPCCVTVPPTCADEDCRAGLGVSTNDLTILGFENAGSGGTGYPLISFYGSDDCDFNDYLDLGQFGTETPPGTPFGVTSPLTGTTGINNVDAEITFTNSSEIRNIGITITGDMGPGVGDGVPAELAAGSGSGIGVGDEILYDETGSVYTIEFSGGKVYAAAVAFTQGLIGNMDVTVEAWDSNANNDILTFDHETFLYTVLSWQNGSAVIVPEQGAWLTKLEFSSNAGSNGFGFGHLALCTEAEMAPMSIKGKKTACVDRTKKLTTQKIVELGGNPICIHYACKTGEHKYHRSCPPKKKIIPQKKPG